MAASPTRSLMPGWVLLLGVTGLLFTAGRTWWSWVSDLSAGMVDPDSRMRLVGVRELVDGKGWYDLVETRIMPPDGIVMHWSRLVDLPLATSIRLLTPFVGREQAEVLTVNLWPSALFLMLLALIALTAFRVGGSRAAEIGVFLVMASPLITVFAPGTIDHHNVQLVLLGVVMAGLAGARDDWRAGAVAGLAAAASIAIGLETVLFLATAGAVLVAAFIIDAPRWRSATIGFGVAFGAGVPLLLAATVDPARWFAPVCDAISPVYAGAAVISGFGVALVAGLPAGRGGSTAADRLVRAGLVALVGTVLLAFVALYQPACLAGPYSQVDPRIQAIWLDHITEAASILDIIRGRPVQVPFYYMAPTIALVWALFLVRRLPSPRRALLVMMLALLGASLAVGSVQVRGTIPAQLVLAVVGGTIAALIFSEGDGGRFQALRRFGWLPLAPVIWLLVMFPFRDPAQEKEAADKRMVAACGQEYAGALASRAPSLVAAPSNEGTYLLLFTPHAVLSAPYHRNAEGILAVDRFFTATPADARSMTHGAGYVLICRQDAEAVGFGRRAPDGLAAALIAGRAPDWLRPVLVNDRTALYEVVPDAAGAPDVTGSIDLPQLRPTISR